MSKLVIPTLIDVICMRLLPVLSLYRSEKNGENIGIIVENKLINRLEINLEFVIITFNYGFF